MHSRVVSKSISSLTFELRRVGFVLHLAAVSFRIFAAESPISTDHWAFRAPIRPELPKIANTSWAQNPIDVFILAKIEEKGLKPSPPADWRTLIRRLSFDLIGLPPTPEEIEAFLRDRSPNAYEKLVDRLLSS